MRNGLLFFIILLLFAILVLEMSRWPDRHPSLPTNSPFPSTATPMPPAPERAPPALPALAPTEPTSRVEGGEESVETTVQLDDPTAELPLSSISNADTLEMLERVIAQVGTDLNSARYGEPGGLSYNAMYLFQESLIAYHRFLRHPLEGPDFSILFHRDFSGRYHFKQERITMGQPTLDRGEGRFLVTLFHEYQHYLFHSIYGTPEYTDITRKFYNELAAHLFENMLAAYLPPDYFIGRHRGGFPQLVYQQMASQDGYGAISLIYDLMVPGPGQRPMYSFLVPASAGMVSKERLLESIDENFNPDSDVARELQAISAHYFETQRP